MRFYSVEALRKNLGGILDRIHYTKEPATITKRNNKIALITPVEEEKVVSEPQLLTAPPPLPVVAPAKPSKPKKK